MSDDIDALAGTRRRAIAVRALRARRPNDMLAPLIADARAVIDALDEDYDDEPYEMTVEQQIRGDALRSAATLLAPRATQTDQSPAGLARFIELWLTAAEAGTTFVDTGRNVFNTTADPAPPLDGDGIADGAVS